VFQDGTEIAYVEPAFKEVKLNQGSPMPARQVDPNARAPPCWSILKSEHCISDQQQPCPVRLRRIAYMAVSLATNSVAFPHFKPGKWL
jgi:hypothetical protein